MQLSVTTDYARDVGDPTPYLRRIARAGFTHVHWCHEWNTDHLYSDTEIARIKQTLASFGLAVVDLHGSVTPGRDWASPSECCRLAGVELARNRIDMAARLGGDVVIMHVPPHPPSQPLRQSLAELEGHARAVGVRIAIENGDFGAIRELLAGNGPEYLGLCYDSGHANLAPDGLAHLESLRDRLISVHLHDNDGSADQHKLPFTGTIDWPRLARILAASTYTKCVSMETVMRHSGITKESEFLAKAHAAGLHLTRFVNEERSAP
jgi:sugar phosphate isomerase/epimerase